MRDACYKFGWLAILTIALCGLAWFTQQPSSGIFPLDDGLIFAFVVPLIERGKVSWGEVLLSPWAGNFYPIWLLQYTAQLRLVGLDAEGLHALNTASQALSALLTYVWLRGLTGQWLGPLLASLLWAMTIIGGYDDPTVMVFEGYFPSSLALLLAGLITGQHIRGPYALFAQIASITFLTLAVLAWEAMLAGFLLFYLQDRWFRSGQRPVTGLWVVLSISFLLLTSIITSFKLWGMPSLASGETPHIVAQLGHGAWHFVESLRRLLMGGKWTDVGATLNGLGLATLSAVWISLLGRQQKLVLLLFLPLPISVVAAVVMLRVPELYYAGDYLYYPTYWHVVSIGLIVERLLQRRIGYSPLVLGTLLLFLSLFAVRQREKAADAAAEYFVVSDRVKSTVERQTQLVSQLAETEDGEPLRLLELPLPVQAELPFPFVLSSLIAWMPAAQRRDIQIDYLDDWTSEKQQRWEQALDRVDSLTARRWKDIGNQLVADIRSLEWAGEQLQSRNDSVSVPGFAVLVYPQFGQWIMLDTLETLCRQPQPAFVKDDRLEVMSEIDVEKLRRLTEVNDPNATAWRSLFDRSFDGRWTIIKDHAKFAQECEKYQAPFKMNVASPASARFVSFPGETPGVRVEGQRPASGPPWTVTLTAPPITFSIRDEFEYRFRMRSDRPRQVRLSLIRNDPPMIHSWNSDRSKSTRRGEK